MSIAERLRRARLLAEMTQMDVKNKTGINNKTISNWEKGVSMPNPNDLATLTKLYHTTADYLLGLVDNPAPPASAPQQPIDINNLTPEQYQHIRYEIYKEEVSAIERERKSPPSSSLADDHQAELA